MSVRYKLACCCVAACLVTCSSPPRRGPPPKPCVPNCLRSNSCAQLDSKLVDAREPMLSCVGAEAKRGNLSAAHRCYRSLRLLESARWWLKTLMNEDELHSVYRPSETFKREFLCRIEELSRAKTAAQVEQLYMNMIRSFP